MFPLSKTIQIETPEGVQVRSSVVTELAAGTEPDPELFKVPELPPDYTTHRSP